MAKKSVRFSSVLVSHTYYIERIDKRFMNDLFYSEKDVTGFQTDYLRSAEREASRRQLSQRKFDRAVPSSTNSDKEEESLNESPKSKTSRKSSKKKGSSKKAPGTSRNCRYSYDDAKDYIPVRRDESSNAKAQGKNASAMDRFTSIVSKNEKDSAKKDVTSSTRSSSNKDSTGASKSKRQEDILLKTAMTLCGTTERQAESYGLDATRYRSNVALEPTSHEKFMSKAMQWKERMARKVSKSLVALSTEVEAKEEKEVSVVPIKKEVSSVQIKNAVADFDYMTMCQTTVFNGSSGGLDATRDRSPISLEPWSQDLPLSKAKQWKES